MSKEVQLFHTVNGPCPYRESGTWENISFFPTTLSPELYEVLLQRGFRRSGNSVYHPICGDCQRCISLRVDTKLFHRSKSQRRTWNKNQDLHIQRKPLEDSDQYYKLYRKYQKEWHHAKKVPSRREYREFLIDTPVETELLCF